MISHARSGRALRVGVTSSTVLPGGTATLTVPLYRVYRGTHPTKVILWYSNDKKKALWRGVVNYPKTVTAPTGTREIVIAKPQLPLWIVAVAAGLGGTVLILLLTLLLLLRRRRRVDAQNTGLSERFSRLR